MSDEIEIVDLENKKTSSQARRWVLTINNPTQTDEEMQEYLENLEHIKYFMFQREKGEKEETIHFQMFVIFSIGKRFNTVKGYFPTAHIEQAKGTNVQCRDYCSKTETRVSGPYEFGQFAEERSRTDIKQFFDMIDEGASDIELRKLFPTLFLKEFNKLNALRMVKPIDYSKQKRDVEVTYVYGESGSGKTTYVEDLTIDDTVFYVDTFDNSAFTGYKGENVLLIDEFKGQFGLQFMNRLLDSSPVKLRGLNFLGQACFTKVYIISNFRYKDLYQDEQKENWAQYQGFVRRLHKIIRIVNFQPIVERETIWEDIPAEEQKPYGRKKRINQMIEYDKFGMSKIIYDKGLYQMQQVELTEVVDDSDLPF